MSSLLPCDGCSRHRRASEKACPFCGSRRLVAGAGVIAFAALGIGWAGVAGTDATTTPQTAPATSQPNARAPVDASADSGGRNPWRQDENVIAIYGAPPQPRRPGC
jgi:uncharacterized iron-regulated membrane protein